MSYTNPLPKPEQVPLTSENLILLGAANATQGAANPHVLSGVAQSSQTVSDGVTNSQAVTQATNIQQVAQSISGQSPKVQQQIWDSMTGPEQQQFESVGYRPPKPSSSGGFLHDISHAIDAPIRAAEDVLHARPINDALNALGAPLRAVQHVERAMAVGPLGSPQSAAANAMPNTGMSRVFSLADWKKAWDITNNGESYIEPQVKRQVLDKYGNAIYQLAYELATGKTQQEILQATPAAQQQAMAQQLQDPTLGQAVNALNAGHISPGRAIVGPGFIARHPEAGKFLSGGVDALFDWFTDPINLGAAHVAQAAHTRYLVSTPEDVQRLYDDTGAIGSNVRRGMADIAQHVRDGSLDSLLTAQPNLKAAAAQLIEAQADTQEKVLEYFKTQAGIVNLIKGSPANAVGEAGGNLPHLSPVGWARLAAKKSVLKRIDWAADKPHEILGETQPTDWSWDENDLYNAVLTNQDTIVSRKVTGAEKLQVGIGRLARRATTLVPQRPFFDANAPDAANVLRDIGLGLGLPRPVVDKAITEFARDPDLGNRWKVYRSLMVQGAHVAGLDTDPNVAENWFSKFLSDNGRIYAPNGRDVKMVGDQKMHAGIFKRDLSEGWSVPNFKDLYLKSNMVSTTQRLTKAINAEWIDRYMNNWRPLTLAHLGFAPRVGFEEMAGFAGREGLGAYMQGSALRSLAKRAVREAGGLGDGSPEDLADAQMGTIWNRMAGHLPSAVTSRISTVNDLWREYMVDYISRAFAKTSTRIAPQEMRDAIAAAMAQDDFEVTPDEITAMHGYEPSAGGLPDGSRYIKTKVNGKVYNAELAPGGDYKLYQAGDTHFLQMWFHMLDTIAADDWGREALVDFDIVPDEEAEEEGATKYVHRTYTDRLNRVAEKLESDPRWQDHIGSVNDRSGRTVASGEITPHQAALDHAAAIVGTVDDAIKSPATGKRIPGLVDHLLRVGKSPSLPALGEVKLEDLPRQVRGPDLIAVSHGQSTISRATGWLFKHQIGPQINWISRQPMYWYQYAKGRQAFAGMAQKWLDEGMSEENVAKLVHENARDRAIAQTINFVHNPQLRSELSTVTRNLSPFWFAQEQFYKRWARTIAYSPATIRKAQLLGQGLRHSGLTHTDPQTGQEYFVYPGSGLVQQVLVDALSRVGINAQIPVEAGLTGQVNMLSPSLSAGLSRVGLPTWGPMVVIPMNELANIDPHMKAAINSIEGPISAQSGFLKALLPATVMHAVEVALPSTDQAQYASAQMQAIQYLEASGHGLGTPAVTPVTSRDIPNPKPGDYVIEGGVGAAAYVYQPDGKWVLDSASTMQTYLDRVQNWARIFLVTRMIYGFSAPASPEIQFSAGNLAPRLNQLLSELPFDTAIATFLQENPDATPYTVFQSQDPAGGAIPATQQAMDFLDANPGLVSQHKDVATYFIPNAASTANYNQNAYYEQLADGLRQKKAPSAFYQQVIYQSAANIYFAAENQKNQMLAAKTLPTSQIDNYWTQWSEAFLQANPIFAQGYSATGSTTRTQIMDDVGAAVNDHTAPDTPQTTALGILYNTWAFWQSQIGSFGNPSQPSLSTAAVMALDEQFAEWLSGFIAENPGVQPLVQRAIQPDLARALDNLSAQGVAVAL